MSLPHLDEDGLHAGGVLGGLETGFAGEVDQARHALPLVAGRGLVALLHKRRLLRPGAEREREREREEKDERESTRGKLRMPRGLKQRV